MGCMMSNSFKDYRSGDLCLLDQTQEDYWQYSRKASEDILLYTEKSSIYETPSKQKFKEGSDVLVRWTDGLLYLGNIIQVDDEFSRCAVKFEDGSQYWALYKDIHKGPPSNNEIICTVCDSGASDPPDEIVICDKCFVGYHQYCHIPKIESSVLKPELSWICRKCVFACTTKKGGAMKKGPKAQAMQVVKQALPYDLHSLTWDAPHRSNLQQTYCYCGGPGEWYMKMLQCLKCKQWFHEACLQCLEEPLLFGDRFYIFVCSVCNKGTEYLRRLALRWPDIAHLVLFNLTVIHGKKYFDLDTTIMHFLRDKWSQLQVRGEELSRSSLEEKKKKMAETLQGNKSRFKSGKEVRQKTTLWALCSRVPPPAPVPALPETVPITDEVLDRRKRPVKKVKASKADSVQVSLKRKKAVPVIDISSDPPKQNGAINKDMKESPKTEGKWQKRRLRPRTARKFSNSVITISDASDNEDVSSSSHDTLNSIIPHPNNFDGPNNPFINSTDSSRSKCRKLSHTNRTCKIPPKPNRHLRNRQSNGTNNKNDSLIRKLSKEKSNSRNKRTFHITSNSKPAISSELNINDLNSSMSSYFGAEDRIANGQKYTVLARRLGSDGRNQYLLQWECASS